MKAEHVYRAGYETFADAAARLPMSIDQVDTSKRLHSALGYRTPEKLETLFDRKAAWFAWPAVLLPVGITPRASKKLGRQRSSAPAHLP